VEQVSLCVYGSVGSFIEGKVVNNLAVL